MSAFTLGIIGTAGRGQDGAKLTLSHWRMMVCIAQTVVTTLGTKHLVSGGSAWADHVAVQLYLDGQVDGLTLHLPCHIFDRPGTWRFETSDPCGARLNELHGQFQTKTGINPFEQLGQAIKRGANKAVQYGGFKGRNTHVANGVDALLAFTFNSGSSVGDSGTADTVGKFVTRRETIAKEANLNGRPWPIGAFPVYHFSLTDRRLFAL